MVTNSLLLFKPCVRPQSQHIVVGKPRTTERPRKNYFLLRRWVKPESVCTFDVHNHTIPCYSVNVKSTKGRCNSSLPLRMWYPPTRSWMKNILKLALLLLPIVITLCAGKARSAKTKMASLTGRPFFLLFNYS